MRNFFLILALLASPAVACDVIAGAGAAHRYQDGYSGPMASVACSLDDKWEAGLLVFGEQSLFDNRLKIDPFPALTGQRVWTFREGKFVRPYGAVGILLKEPDRCTDVWVVVRPATKTKPERRQLVYDLECNRLMPEWWAFLLTAGVQLGENVRISLVNHASTAGVSFPNSGQDFARFEWRF